jgi:tetratricopeptide (TPR) repeat protein
MLRSANGEIVRFKELTTLQQWIVERKVTRQDQISRGGENWKELGGIAELASFFHVVEQAQAVAHASQPGLAIQRGAAASLASSIGEIPTELLPSTPRAHTLAEEVPTLQGMRRRSRSGGALGLVVLLSVVGLAGAWYMLRRPPSDVHASAEMADLARRGHTSLLTDTDDGFRQAISALDRSLELVPAGAAPSLVTDLARADLAEAHVTWAAYLHDDATNLEAAAGAAGVQAAKTMRAEAQTNLERARRVLEEAGAEQIDASAALSRAFGDLLRVEGAPAPAVDKYLQHAAQKSSDDPELAYALGRLLLREGKQVEGIAQLQSATHGTDGGLIRARYALARYAQEGHRIDDLRTQCEVLEKIAPRHDRAHSLCTVTPTVPPDLGVPHAADAGMATVASNETKVREPIAPPADYKSLLREGDRLSENGHSKEARKLYERALELDPRGVAALTGLGYCDLDAERFMQAVDRFNAALSIDPNNGDAVMGLAESYKVRGQNERAIAQYEKYLATHPAGPKASMAQKNLRDLQPRPGPPKEPKESRDDSDETPKSKGDNPLPRPPQDDTPPP